MKKHLTPNALTVPLIAFLMLAALSSISWSDITDGKINDFSLFGDLLTESIVTKTTEIIDPALQEAIAEVTSDLELPLKEFEEKEADTKLNKLGNDQELVKVVSAAPDRIDGILPIEDYSSGGDGLVNFRKALAERDTRPVRIAVIGDSYIEGDIFTQDIRKLLQAQYGGRGVGYMSMHSDFPGFRRSVVQKDNGWTVCDIRHKENNLVKPISGEYCIGAVGASASFKGAKIDGTQAWSVSQLLFIAPAAGTVTLSTAAGDETYEVAATDAVQKLELIGETNEFRIKSDIDGLVVLGVWLDDGHGISLDCMSLRGNSGASHRLLSSELASEMSAYIDYDLVVVEYGINALSSEQNEYSAYAKLMSSVICRLKQCYPNADILMFGVGDRGQKSGSDVASLPTVGAMTKAQRDCAKSTGVMFWDVRAAMGGDNSIVDWRDRGLVNADYIHLNHNGGAKLAEEFVKSLNAKINGSY